MSLRASADIRNFFGPNVKAEVFKVDSEKRILALKLTTIPAEEYETLMNTPVVVSEDEPSNSLEAVGAKDEAKQMSM